MAAGVQGLTVDDIPMKFIFLNGGPEKKEETVRTEGSPVGFPNSPYTVSPLIVPRLCMAVTLIWNDLKDGPHLTDPHCYFPCT